MSTEAPGLGRSTISTDSDQSFPYPGIPATCDGAEAVVHVETNVTQGAGAFPISIDTAHIASQVRLLPMPPPKRPKAGSPKWPKIKDQLSKAFRPMPKMLSHRMMRGRSSAETKLRSSWNSSQGAVHHM